MSDETIGRLKPVKQHEIIACPDCGEENRVPGSLLLSNDDLICPECEETIGRANEEGEFAEVRVPLE